jgi:pyruvate dehydrogenase E1 component beta subunit
MGIGMGSSLMGVPSLYLMKQHDFALLGLDQLDNTYNLIRNKRMKAPFIVVMVVVDSGFEGPQSNLNNLDDFASITKANVHFLNTYEKISTFKELNLSNDLHFVAVSQKNLKKEISQNLVTFLKGDEYFNLYRFKNKFQTKIDNLIIYSGTASILNEQYIDEIKNMQIDIAILHKIDKDIRNIDLNLFEEYRNVYIFSPSKSLNNSLQFLHSNLLQLDKKVVTQFQKNKLDWTQVNSDEFNLDLPSVIEFFSDPQISV